MQCPVYFSGGTFHPLIFLWLFKYPHFFRDRQKYPYFSIRTTQNIRDIFEDPSKFKEYFYVSLK